MQLLETTVIFQTRTTAYLTSETQAQWKVKVRNFKDVGSRILSIFSDSQNLPYVTPED